MGKTIVVVIIALLSLACGALGWEVLRQVDENKSLQEQLAELKAEITELSAAAQAKQSEKWATEDALNDLRTYLETLDERTKELLAKQKELDGKLASAGKSGPVLPKGSIAGFDLDNIPKEQRDMLAELARNAAKALDTERIGMFKKMAKQRINLELDKNADKLGLTPLQKSDLAELIDTQVDKGFKTVGAAFEKGDWQAIRQQIRQIIEESDLKLKEILDPDQIEKLRQLDPRGFGRREAEREKNK